MSSVEVWAKITIPLDYVWVKPSPDYTIEVGEIVQTVIFKLNSNELSGRIVFELIIQNPSSSKSG